MRTVVVTGATSGVGSGVATGLARQGARLVLLGRESERGERAAAELSALGATVERVPCDLGERASVRAAAERVAAEHPRIDALVSCAGVLPWKRRVTADGVEATWATNVLGPVLLAELLARRVGRIVTITGDLHRHGTIHWDDPELAEGWSPLRAGTQSVLAKLMWALHLARRLAGTPTTVHAFCPGFVRSDLTREFPWLLRPVLAFSQRFAASPEEGAATALWLATSPELDGKTGGYWRHRAPVDPSPLAADRAAQDRLFSMLAAAVGPLPEAG